MNKTYISEALIRKQICEIGDKIYAKGFVAANDGNISVRLDDKHIIVTPTGVSKGGMRPEQLVKMTLDGEVIGKNKPSSEVKMHLMAYNQNPKIRAVVHAHPPIATAFAVVQKPMDQPILAEAVVSLGIVPVAPYATPGTVEVPNSIKGFVNEYNAVLLANHGLLTWGETLEQAYFRMETAEHYGKILLYVNQIGQPKEFSCDELNTLLEIRKNMGVEQGGTPTCKRETKETKSLDDHITEITKKVLRELKK
jgi:L-fuculose-phosphate aldolase